MDIGKDLKKFLVSLLVFGSDGNGRFIGGGDCLCQAGCGCQA